MTYIWLGALLLFVIAEAATLGLTSVWFALGALFSLVAAMCGAQLWLQIVLFILVSAVSLYFTRPLVKKYFNSKREPTNADRIIGAEAVVTREIDNSTAQGEVRVNGQIWSARSKNDAPIAEGIAVTITAISGVKAVVEIKEE